MQKKLSIILFLPLIFNYVFSQDAKEFFKNGLTELGKGNLQLALSNFDKVILLDTFFTEAYYNRGYIKDEMKDFSGALIDYNKAIFLNPYNFQFYFNRAYVKENLKDWQGAMDDYTKTIAINDSLIDTYINRGFLYLRLKQKEKACEDWRKAEELGAGDATELIRENCR